MRRRLVAAAALLGVLLTVASLTQLKPYRFDTYDVGRSLERFESSRAILMGGSWARLGIVFPAVLLAGELYRRDREPLVAALLATGGIVSAVAGAVATVIGVAAEEYRPGSPDSHAVEVTADTLFWVQDNLTTVAGLLFAGAALASVAVGRRPGPVGLWGGRLALPLFLIATTSWFFSDAEVANALAAPWYAGFGLAALATFLAWLWAVARADAP